MTSRAASFLLAMICSLAASGAGGVVHSVPVTLGSPGGLAARPGAGLSLAPVSSAGLGLASPAILSLRPAIMAASAVGIGAAAVAAPAVARSVAAASVPMSRAPAAAGRVVIVRNYYSHILGNWRDIAIYLPPGYDESDARYAVLYMNDGQNLFDPATAYQGRDWGLAQTLDRLIALGEMAHVIVVAPYNIRDRKDDLTPVPYEGGGGKGDRYGRFLSDELKPFIDAKLRTRRQAQHTAIMGASLGGVSALHLALTRPEIFSRAGALSPSLWWADEYLTRWMLGNQLPEPRPRLWINMGDYHASNIEQLRNFKAALLKRGWVEDSDLKVLELQGDTHNEPAWKEGVVPILKFLFPPEPRLSPQ